MSRIVILTVGTRGDVQPYAALALGLQRAGHDVTLAAPLNFRAFVENQGIRFAPLRADYLELASSAEGKRTLGGDPRSLSRLLREQVVPAVERILEDAWAAAHGAQALVFHPKVLAGPHLAERLNVPAFAAATVPMLSPTTAFPLPGLLPPTLRLGAAFNRHSYRLLGAASWPFRKVIARWRERIGLPAAFGGDGVRDAGARRLPVLYCYSATVVPRPSDWDTGSTVTGYWNLPSEPFSPGPDLVRFLEAGPPPVYLGFGSMTHPDPVRLTHEVLAALETAGVRALISGGWGALDARSLPDFAQRVDNLPHEWLFPRLAAAVHHGGMGTTAAALQAGIPMVVCPFATDQPFWAERAYRLGVAPRPLPARRLRAQELARALEVATGSDALRLRSREIAERLRLEDGVRCAVAEMTRSLV
ncbi:sterol 3beta-glucosyltransferase [Deinobacterium chartae]|uniref:Sterol 3beta-glucosyltransferase n=1 Tax=Deinobacterium chartae TaxID=521158 RepID=A0A841HZS0_9DEIO|nr:glycosyltransferase [Deinobacterium chartae]MBB6098897.1 sterol 3beta-glucosyltransferase [Deinobacterium chartae]